MHFIIILKAYALFLPIITRESLVCCQFNLFTCHDRINTAYFHIIQEDAKADMEKMLDYIDTLNELDTHGIEPMSHVFPVKNVFREDVVTNGDGSAETLANAPLEKDQSFKVPKTIG